MVYDTYTIITIVNKPTYNALKNQKSFASSGLNVNQYRCKLETPTPLPDKVPVTIGQPKKCISEFLQVSPLLLAAALSQLLCLLKVEYLAFCMQV